MAQHDPRLFFQVAAGLIPALIFGGLISDKLKPSPSTRRWPLAFVLQALALAVLLAEVLAINAALTGDPDAVATWLVALVLVGLTAAALGILVAPWYRQLMIVGSPGRRQRIANYGVIAVLSTFVVVESARLLVSAVQAEQSFQRLAAALSSADKRDTASQLLAAYDRMYQARAAAGLVPKTEARSVHVCLTDRAFLEAFQGALESLVPSAKPLPVYAQKALLPGKPIQCRGVVALPDPLPGLGH